MATDDDVTCRELVELVTDYVEGTLPLAERRRFAAHLGMCSIFPYLDREVSVAEQAEVERHIAACPGCEEHVAFDGTVLTFVRQRASHPLIEPDLQAGLLAPFKGRSAPQA